MLITVERVQNKQIKRFLGHITYLTIVLLLVPTFLYFELCIVLPAVVEIWSIQYIIHYFCASFLLLNIIGNMIYGMFTNTTIKGKFLETAQKEDWTMCSACESLRPPRAWHCTICDICVLKRDHHCTFFACCVGYYNHRYFMYFTLYIFIAMMYSFYFNVIFLSQFVTWNHGLLLVRFIFPLASFVIDFSVESWYMFLVVINFVVGIFTGFLFLYHFNNILKGRLTPETKLDNIGISYNQGWQLNLIEVFGQRWYLTWILPFISSPLPGNGIEWVLEDKHK
ncbi:probable palmitoyltransferase ZDHHC24 [Maniola hyperantus]|uniref:probable palmitoyltransferase ZDHHC24 n=1 Tax=Aphantopus hyperantus TaxID=2795564 RepID=UPI002122601D